MLSRSRDDDGFELSPIKAMELAASRVPGAVSLAQGIPSFNTPLVIRDFVRERIAAGMCDRYSLTNGLPELRDEISLALRDEGLNYSAEREILVTCGAAEAVAASVMSCTRPGDEVIIPTPTYVSYLGAIGMARCVPRFVALDEDNNFDFHVERMAAAIGRNTSAIIYCSPNNPTGTLFSEAKSRAIIELAQKHNLTVIIDEVYKDFYYGAVRHYTPASITDARDSVIRICSFSKAYAMTGWRVGFVHSSTRAVSRILKYHDSMVTCAPVASQYAAIAALRWGDEARREFQREFKRRRDFTITQLDKLSHVLDYQIPEASYFVFPRIKDTVALSKDSRALAYEILEKVGLALVPGSAFGPAGESHLRISFGRELPVIEEGMQRLARYFTNSRSDRSSRAATRKEVASGGRRPTIFRSIVAGVLALCARIFLKRINMTVIGIAGTRGKTVFKRVLYEGLRERLSVRAGILSYNTEFGLPLSILNLVSPRTLSERLSFVFKLVSRTLFSREGAVVLIVEYGVMSTTDSDRLLRICIPDWLIISPVSGSDLSLDYQSIIAGIARLASSVPPSHILWDGTDPLLKATPGNWTAENVIYAATGPGGVDGTAESSGDSYAIARSVTSRILTFLMSEAPTRAA